MSNEKRLFTVRDQIHSREEVKRRVVDAASRLYARRGFHHTSMEQIAEAADVTLPVVQSYVKSKSMIMQLIMEDLLDAFEKRLALELEETDSPEERLSRAFALFCRIVADQKEKVLLLYRQSHVLDADARQSVKDHEVAVSRCFAGIIEVGTARGVFKKVDADLAAYNMLMLAYMWTLKGWHFRDRMTLETFIRQEMDFLLQTMK
jgi:AcrR family transcriptional regulator